jgi:hypothetical protein
MIKVYIKYPIWATKSVGISRKIIKDDLLIEILYIDKEGKRLFPNLYAIHKATALSYPKKDVQGTKLHIIPIADMKEISGEEREQLEYKLAQGITYNF